MLSAPVCVLLYRPRRVWWLAMAVSVVASLTAAATLARVLSEGPFGYALGGWAAPWGIEYRIDALNALVALLVSVMSAVVLPFARLSVDREVPENKHYLFYCAWLLCLTGLLGILVTGDAFNVFVFLEISSLASYTLVSFGPSRAALTAAYRYLIMGTIGGTFFLIGVGFLYAATGTLNMADLALRLEPLRDSAVVQAGFGFIVIGLALKVAMFPMHAWLPAAYANAPSAVTAFIAATSTKVALYLILRFTFTVFGDQLSVDELGVDRILLTFGSVGVLVASLIAIFQQELKRLLAWSSVAQVGYMLIGVAVASVDGLTGSITLLFNHALMKSALFLAVGCVVYRIGTSSLESVAGLGWRMPWTFAALALAGLSLIGVPLTAGFVSKWYLVISLIDRGWWLIAVLLVLTSLMAVIYVGKIVEAAYFREPRAGTVADRAQEAPLLLVVPTWVIVVANYYFGIETSLTVGVGRVAAAGLLGVSP